MAIISRFTLSVPGLSHDAFSVVSFKGEEYLSKPYRFDITLASEKDDLDLFNRGATLAIKGREDHDPPARYHGIISEFAYIDSTDHANLYRAILEPKIARIARTRHSHIYLEEQTIPELIASVLKDTGEQYGFTALDFEMRIYHEQDYRKRSFIHQHEESCLDFISRHMERDGMYYYFRQEEDREVVVITDDRAGMAKLDRCISGRIVL